MRHAMLVPLALILAFPPLWVVFAADSRSDAKPTVRSSQVVAMPDESRLYTRCVTVLEHQRVWTGAEGDVVAASYDPTCP